MKKTWNINDIAFIIYARYKGLQYKDIGKILGVSASSVAQQFLKLNNPSNYSKKTQSIVDKGQVLEAQIRSGEYPDHREMWDKRISSINGVTYAYRQAEPEVEEKPQDEPIEELVKYNPIIEFKIDTNALVAVINAWRK